MLKTLIISQGPIPLNDSSVVEGGGVRVNAIWKGLLALGIPASVAVPMWAQSESDDSVYLYEDVQSLCDLASGFDAIIYNYAAGSQITELLNNLPSSILRIADSYVPIHIEVAARRNTHELEREQKDFERDLNFWNSNLMQSDIYLVTSESQEKYYMGVLSSLGRISPSNYNKQLLFLCPTGSDADIVVQKKTVPDSLTILWWGGFYPWFKPEDLKDIAEALLRTKQNVSFKIIGPKNPFVENRQFIELAQTQIQSLSEVKNISIHPWVPFGERKQIFENCQIMVTLSQPGHESSLSWRTRLVDAVDFETPVITNGGDPFSEYLISQGAASRIPSNPKDIVDYLRNELTPLIIRQMSERMKIVKSQLSFQECSKPIFRILENQSLAAEYTQDRLDLREPNDNLEITIPSGTHSRGRLGRGYGYLKLHGFSQTARRIIQKIKSKARIAPLSQIGRGYGYLKLHGFSQTARRIIQKIKSKARIAPLSQTREKGKQGIEPNARGTFSKFLLIQHQTDKSGAPLVGIEIASALKESQKWDVTVLSGTPVEDDLLINLNDSGIKLVSRQPHESIEDLLEGSSFVLNSSAVPHLWISESLRHLQTNEESLGAFYIHENEPETFLSEEIARHISVLSKDRLKVFVPSLGTSKRLAEKYSDSILHSIQNYRVAQVPKVALRRKLKDIKVALVGPTGDFRKRHLDVILATSMAIKSSQPHFREISLVLIGVGDDPIGLEVGRLAKELVPDSLISIFGRVPHRQVLEILSECNTVVSVADNESFGIYMAEAMTGGAVTLRTRISGYEEQVIENVNGYGLSDPIFHLTEKLLDLANPSTTTDEALLQMLESSVSVSRSFVNSRYENILEQFLKI
jgi:glycosyltransferase involved in cell wall biosynthesis